jgi:hypothetical protein
MLSVKLQGRVVEIEYTITEQEYVKANKLFTQPTRNIIYFYIVAAITLLIVAVLAESVAIRIGALAGLFAGFLGQAFVRHIYSPWQTRKQFKAYKAAQAPVTISCNDTSLHFKSESGEGFLEWNKINKWRENGGFLLIYEAPCVYHIVPKRIGELSDEIRQSLVEHLGNAT